MLRILQAGDRDHLPACLLVLHATSLTTAWCILLHWAVCKPPWLSSEVHVQLAANQTRLHLMLEPVHCRAGMVSLLLICHQVTAWLCQLIVSTVSAIPIWVMFVRVSMRDTLMTLQVMQDDMNLVLLSLRLHSR
jgi:hypothetical protein